MPSDTTIEDAAHNKSTLNMLKRLVKTYLAPHTRPLILALFLMIVAGAMTASIAQLMQPILDDVLGGAKKHLIIPVGTFALVTFFVRGLATYGHTIIMTKISQSIVADVQKDLFSHFMILDLSFFHNNPSGQLVSRVINDVTVMRIAVGDSLTAFGKSFFTLIFLIGVMFYQDWKLTLAAFCIFPLAGAFVAYIGKRLRDLSKNIQSELGNLSDRLIQIFQGIRQVQAYGMESHENKRAHQAIETVKRLNIKAVRVGQMSTPVNETLVGLVVFGIIIYGGYEAAQGKMTAGQLGAFIAAFMFAYEPMKKLARLNNTVQTGLGAAERIFDMLDLQPEIKDSQSAKAVTFKKPEIVFDKVDFSYDGADEKALSEISFTAKSGEVTALVGPSGGGKTTIMNLIPRLYDPSAGCVNIDGHDVKQMSLASLRSQIALVSQDITIFDETILSNIAYGSLDASEAEIIEAAKAAEAHGFIEIMPDGYDTLVGEDGVKLSGGQRQRIAIARAILRDAPILLLDEATSALDNESEKAVQKALKKLEQGRTTIVIAHRLSTVQNANQILVLDKGKIVEQGTHATLMKDKGLYAKLYALGLQE